MVWVATVLLEFFKASYLSISTVMFGLRADFSKEKSWGALPALKGKN